MTIADSPRAREVRMVLAINLAASVDSARRMPPVETPLLNWCEGDAIVQLLHTLAGLLGDEPLAELSDELAEKLRARLGLPPDYDLNTMLGAVGKDIRRRRPTPVADAPHITGEPHA
ncbi:hypothetical protein [Microbispora sp. ATCC PTA-5024]|uniref:hypothetical protein n=1 Tax=Microbispora sp. ATCC PTA-5024 TaxID=316330 RepID=UPI0012EE86F2|nr:hypothetical protein [Microbispora sp. ATCC PTA-5024]